MSQRFSTTGNIMPKRSWRLLALVLLLCLTSCAPHGDSGDFARGVHFTYEASEEAFYNPLIGFAPEADYEEAVGEHTLVYVGVLWKDIEPEEGVYDFSQIEEVNHLEQWREEGKHVVLRFICDKPSEEEHMDIPQWLYEKTGDGTFYAYDSTHKGYSPDYSNEVLIEAHARAIEALGEYFGQDTFVSYVELGSLGHWGEWHVNYEEGIVRLPKEEVREEYVTPYLDEFPHAKLLMRRPFNTAEKYGFGLYDDTAGNPESTSTWLEWIQEGGDYNQAEEENALSPMPDAWKTAPIGGELNSDIPMTTMLSSQLETTVSLLEQSHTSFLGPYCPTALKEETGLGYEACIDAVRKTLGYRLRIEEAAYEELPEESAYIVSLTWQNDGVAPMYWDWNVYLYSYDENQTLLGRWPVDVQTTALLPGETVVSQTEVSAEWLEQGHTIALGIEDPMVEEPAVYLAMETERIGLTHVLWTKS